MRVRIVSLFAALVVGIVLALAGVAPKRVPRRIGLAAQGVLGVYIGTMVHRDAVSALSSDWPIVLAVAVATLVLSVAAGALLSVPAVVFAGPYPKTTSAAPGRPATRSPMHLDRRTPQILL